MLDVLRSLELAIESSKDSNDSTLEGVRLTAESMRSSLASEGIVEIEIQEGMFDLAAWKQLRRSPHQRVLCLAPLCR